MIKLTKKFSEQYPLSCTKLKWKQKNFYKNFYVDGNNINILKDHWSPLYVIWYKINFISIQYLLTDPNLSSTANVEVAKLYNDNIR